MAKPNPEPVVKKGKATIISHKVADRLKELRRRRGMTQSVFADYIGVSFQQYQKYEKGKDRISLEKAMILCAQLNMPLDVFMGGAEAASGFGESTQQAFGAPPKTPLKFKMSVAEKELLDLYATVPVKSRKAFLEMVRGLAKMSSGKK